MYRRWLECALVDVLVTTHERSDAGNATAKCDRIG
jgi:hypothetical protein